MRIFLGAVVSSLAAGAALAIGILLFGDFGDTEGRILATTALTAAYALVALPAGILFDQARLSWLAWIVLALSAAGLALSVGSVWSDDPPDELSKTLLSVTVLALAATQTAALASRRRVRDPRAVRGLFAASAPLALVLAALAAAAAWAEIENERYFRIVGALTVLDVLVVALQPVLALARPAGRPHALRLLVEPGGTIETTVEAADFATAAARAIRAAERRGGRVERLERLG